MAQAQSKMTVALTAARPRGRHVAYAEELGLTALPMEAKGAEEALGVLYHQRALSEKHVREWRDLIAKAEHSIMISERADNPEMAVTAFERHVKTAVGNSRSLAEMNQNLRDAQDKLGGIDAEIKANEVVARNRQAEMRMLGGYFEYLAVSKESANINRIFGDTP